MPQLDPKLETAHLHQFVPFKPISVQRLFLRLISLILILTASVLVHGFYTPPLPEWGFEALNAVSHIFNESDEQLYIILTRILQTILITAYWYDVIRIARSRSHATDRRMTFIDILILAITLTGIILHLAGNRLGWPIFEISVVIVAATELWHLNTALSRRLHRPGLLLPLSFFFLIAIGTPLLKLPLATPINQSISWLDSLFTITSAVCVTGLAVKNTAHDFTPFGQTIIAIFIQLGGLGIIIFASMFALMLGRSLSLKQNVSLSQMLSDQPLHKITSFIRFIVLTTLIIETIGALLLLPMWQSDPTRPLLFTERLGMSFFHAISAFCNAGFDITGDSFHNYRTSAGIYLVIIPLIVLGGLGFPVLGNLYAMFRYRISDKKNNPTRFTDLPPVDLSPRRLSLHSKVVLTTTASLLILGTLVIAISELTPFFYVTPLSTSDPLSISRIGQTIADAAFMSTSSRTAGFYSANTPELQPSSHLTLLALMIVGGSPGSTAGGIKTTIFALLLLSIIANMRQRPEAEIFKRTIPQAAIQKAGTIFFCYIGLIITATYLLTLTEPFTFIQTLFEVVSAATTTGLSLGITEQLTPFGKIVIILVMFLGRVGPLALLSSLILSRRHQTQISYPHEDIALG
ncbi:Ktr system potassium uptake protein B [Poriferisphaera corsica]|uniref:Ktr system potassium uptake protein B n=1 Tax=Poriferisphaera corsica TaxID=2528020 RepID=A0A517YW33_9BACT|nr:potassium transporter TrkG [Poriferisphaera corsica]QDU34437.1 Ktr system potassium uptake protein B [Poriferisphaera corsica]